MRFTVIDVPGSVKLPPRSFCFVISVSPTVFSMITVSMFRTTKVRVNSRYTWATFKEDLMPNLLFRGVVALACAGAPMGNCHR